MKLDDVAADIAAKALRDDHTGYTTAEEYSLAKTKVVITAYFKALEADGLAIKDEIDWCSAVDDGNNLGVQIEKGVPVTIIRERPQSDKEQS